MFRKPSGGSMVEYVVLIALIVSLVLPPLLLLIDTIWTKLANTNVNLGS